MSAQGPIPPTVAPNIGRHLLDATIDPSLTGSDYVDQIAKLNILIPATRSWKDGEKWPHESIPQQIAQYQYDVTGPMLIRVGLFGKLEALRFWDDLNRIVEMVWGSWDSMHAARHTRQWDVKKMRDALVEHLWSIWEHPAGFPKDEVIIKWFTAFVAYRVKNTRRSKTRQRSTSPKPVKKPKIPRARARTPATVPRFHVPHIKDPTGPSNAPPALPRQNPVPGGPLNARAPARFHIPQAAESHDLSSAPLARTTTTAQNPDLAQLEPQQALYSTEPALENLFPLAAMNLIVSWSSEWNGTQEPPTDEPAYALNVGRLGITTLGNDYFVDPDRSANVIAQALQFSPINWNPQHEYLILLNSQGGLHYSINSPTPKNKGKILEALREERRRNQMCLKIKIVKQFQNFAEAMEHDDMMDAGERCVTEPTNKVPPSAPGVQNGNSTPVLQSTRHVVSGHTATAIPLGFMTIIVSRSSQWNGSGYPPDDQPSYATTLSTLVVHSIEDLPAGANVIVHWLKSDPVKWNAQQKHIMLFGSKVGESQCVDETGTDKILGALLEERERNVSCLKMKIAPRFYDLGSASENDTVDTGED